MTGHDILLFNLLVASLLPLIFERNLWLRIVCSISLLASTGWAVLGVQVSNRVALPRLDSGEIDPKTLTYFDGCYAMQEIIAPHLSIILLAVIGLTVLALVPRRKQRDDPTVACPENRADPA